MSGNFERTDKYLQGFYSTINYLQNLPYGVRRNNVTSLAISQLFDLLYYSDSEENSYILESLSNLWKEEMNGILHVIERISNEDKRNALLSILKSGGCDVSWVNISDNVKISDVIDSMKDEQLVEIKPSQEFWYKWKTITVALPLKWSFKGFEHTYFVSDDRVEQYLYQGNSEAVDYSILDSEFNELLDAFRSYILEAYWLQIDLDEKGNPIHYYKEWYKGGSHRAEKLDAVDVLLNVLWQEAWFEKNTSYFIKSSNNKDKHKHVNALRFWARNMFFGRVDTLAHVFAKLK